MDALTSNDPKMLFPSPQSMEHHVRSMPVASLTFTGRRLHIVMEDDCLAVARGSAATADPVVLVTFATGVTNECVNEGLQ